MTRRPRRNHSLASKASAAIADTLFEEAGAGSKPLDQDALLALLSGA